MISISHWGIHSVSLNSEWWNPKIKGPVYADRVRGRLTFRDWDSWTPDDQNEYHNFRAE